ncbi:MAG TPA: VIT domain-containing protein, partial [Nannocystaceae bacterium]|nr:VIT domain-containing protein [Nannocystaceae bacterium]
HAQVRGHIADVEVTQTFVNSRKHPIEVVYTFPLPENAAVHDLKLVIGERVIESDIRKRADAQREYADARAAGHTAALLEQERPNVFTQNVANIPAGAKIEVEVHYLQTISQDAGTSELVFPMVVGPRYNNDSVKDAARISPPVLGKGVRSGHDVSLTVQADAGLPIADFRSIAHEVVAKRDGSKLSVTLAKKDELANRDFVLRWKTEAKTASSVLWLGPTDDRGEGHFELLVEPPHIDLDARIGRRELVFVVDVSGSMTGPPLALAKRVMRAMIAELRPVDTFDVITFESGTRRLFEQPMPANDAAITKAIAFIDGLQAGGGTEMAAAVDAALGTAVGKGRNRFVVFATDGYIGNENEIFAGAQRLVELQQKAGHVARVFAIGIGSSPNRHLLDGLAQAGQGLPIDVMVDADAPRTVTAVRRWIDARVLEGLAIDWGGLKVDGAVPGELPDLFASHAVIVHGRFKGSPSGPIVLRGKSEGRDVEIAVTIAKTSEHDDTLRTLWARAKVAEIEPRLWAGVDAAAEAEITELGLEHRLVTAYTSLIAIDRSRKVEGRAERIVQPVEVPEGVDPVMAGATMYEYESEPLAAPMAMADEADAPVLYSKRKHARASEREESVARERDTKARAPGLELTNVAHDAGVREAAIRHVFRMQRRALAKCFDGGYATLEVTITLAADGTTSVSMGTTGDADVDACVESRLRTASWPSVRARSSFTLELRFG